MGYLLVFHVKLCVVLDYKFLGSNTATNTYWVYIIGIPNTYVAYLIPLYVVENVYFAATSVSGEQRLMTSTLRIIIPIY